MNSNWDAVFQYLSAAHRQVAAIWTGTLSAFAILAVPFFIVFNNFTGEWLLWAFLAAWVWLFVAITRWAFRVGPSNPFVRMCFVVALTIIVVGHHQRQSRR